MSLVTCPPYDVISAGEQEALLARDPRNLVRVELPEGADQGRYERAAAALAKLRDTGVLVTDAQPSVYLHETRYGEGEAARTRRAVLALVRLHDWDERQVLPHEQTMAGPKVDRLNLLRATRANVSPLWMLYRGSAPALAAAWSAALGRSPEHAFSLSDGTAHRLWALPDAEQLCAELSATRLVIADGHHRYETALTYRDELAQAGELAPEHPARFVLAYLTAEDDPGLEVLPTHRLVGGLGALDQVELESELGPDWHAEYYHLWDNSPPEQLAALLEQLRTEGQQQRAIGLLGPDPTVFAILLLRNKNLLEERAPGHSAAWRALDVALLEVGLLGPLLDRAGVEREEALRYERDARAAMEAVLSGESQLAFFLNPTPPAEVVSVAEAGDRMPEKSTYFYPKPPTGLVVRVLEP